MAEDQEFTLPPLEERPLVTFALFAYNQEKYIREAVEGAFAQTYEPLEIILSDDCSTDRTFEIMKSLKEKYRGPHKITLNRNPRNLGISHHVSLIHQYASGSVIVNAAGDDISYPTRVEKLVQALVKKKSVLISSSARRISCDGEELKTEEPDEIAVLGCSLALRKELVTLFPPPLAGMHTEDSLLIQRAKMVGRIDTVKEKLLDYRIHGNNASLGLNLEYLKTKEILERAARSLKSHTTMTLQYLADSVYLGKPIEERSIKERIFSINCYFLKSEVLAGSFFRSTSACALGYCLTREKYLFWLLIQRWIPFSRPIYQSIKNIRSRFF